MRKFCRIENNIVREVFDLDEHHPDRAGIEGLFHPSLDWRIAPAGCAEGWLVHEGSVVPPDHYAVRRVKEYPPLTDFIDGFVKSKSKVAGEKTAGDAQVQAYCDACLAVKAKYPKP